jgi:hypothetical protein
MTVLLAIGAISLVTFLTLLFVCYASLHDWRKRKEVSRIEALLTNLELQTAQREKLFARAVIMIALSLQGLEKEEAVKQLSTSAKRLLRFYIGWASMFDIGSMLEKMGENMATPTTRDTVEDCGKAVLGELLGIWMDGNSKLATEMDHLLKALMNKSDPMLQELGWMEKQTMITLVNTLRKQKEFMHASKKQE